MLSLLSRLSLSVQCCWAAALLLSCSYIASRSAWDKLRNRRIMHRFSHSVRFSGLGSSFQRSSSHSQPCSTATNAYTYEDRLDWLLFLCAYRKIHSASVVFEHSDAQIYGHELMWQGESGRKIYLLWLTLMFQQKELPNVPLSLNNKHLHLLC